MLVKLKKLHECAELPKQMTDGSAGFDVVGASRVAVPGEKSMIYDLGFSAEIPKGHVLKFYIRSSLAFNHDISISNDVPIIDSDYRGPIKIKLTYYGMSNKKPDWPYVGDRIAQALLEKTVKTSYEWVDELNETERGTGGFGSTGA